MRPARTALALTAAVLLAAAPAGAQGLGATWRVSKVALEGTATYRYDALIEAFAMDGTARYRGGRSKETFEIKLSNRRPVVVIASPVRYTSTTTAEYTEIHDDGSVEQYDCSYELPRAGAPKGLTAVLMARPSGIRIQWSLQPPTWRCPEEGDVTFDPLPTKAFVTRQPLKTFAGKRRVRLPVRISYEDGDPLRGFERTISWSGHVELER